MVSNIETVTIFEGFPARATRGYLGWSSDPCRQIRTDKLGRF